MEDQNRCDMEIDVGQMDNNERQIGSWLCCLPCYWLRRNSGFHKMSLTFATLLVTVVLVASPVIFLISTIPGDKSRDCSYQGKDCGLGERVKICLKEQCSVAASRILASMSSETDPCQDFYHFACGSWGKMPSKFPRENQSRIPEDHFVNFVTLQKQVDRTVQQLLAVTANSDPFQRLGIFYRSCIRAGNKRISLLPMFSLLDDLGGYVTPPAEPPQDLTNLVLSLLRLNGAPLFDIYWDLDLNNSSKFTPLIDLPLRVGLGLGSKQWWRLARKIPNLFENILRRVDSSAAASRTFLKEGEGRAYNFIKASLEEKRLVIMERIMQDFIPQNMSQEIKMTETQTTLHFANMITKLYPKEKEVMKSYQGEVNVKMKLSEVERRYPFVRWQYLLEKFLHARLAPQDDVFILAPDYLNSLQRILPRFGSRVTHNGLLLIFATDNLYELVNTSLVSDRPTFCSRLTVSVFSKAVSILYVRQYTREYIDQLRIRINQIFNNLKKSFERRIEKVSWLDESARKAVFQKLAAIKAQFLTWPNFWNTTYASSLMRDIVVDPDDFFGNVIRMHRNLRNISTDVGHREFLEERWAYPLVVNAFYILTANTIIIPLALMTQPYFREDVPLYIPYSTIGLIFAHEILHGFDLKGIGYDSEGKPGLLLPTEAKAKLEARLDCFVKQFSSSFWKKVNFLGKSVDIQFDWNMTKNENMADISGLQIAFQAWKSVTESENEASLPGVDLSPQQLFFLNAAQGKRNNDEFSRFCRSFQVSIGLSNEPKKKVLYLVIAENRVTKCESKIELRAVLLSCPAKDSGCDDDDLLSQATNVEEAQIIEPRIGNFQATKEEKENGFSNSVKDCKRKLIITVKVKNTGKIPCDDEYIIVDHVFDPVTGGKGRLLSPVILKLRQEQMVQLYGLQFQRVVNSDPYEEQKNKEVCSVTAENPTCGTAFYDGKPIPFSEGFCCSCDPFVNAKRELPPLGNKDSFLYRDSTSEGVSRFVREEKSVRMIVNPDLVRLDLGMDSEDVSKASDEDRNQDDCPIKDIKDLSLDKIPNFMIERDRKIVCDKGDFLNELCKMRDEKQNAEGNEGTTTTISPPKADAANFDVYNINKERVKESEGVMNVVYDDMRSKFTTIPSAADLTDPDSLSHNEMMLKTLLGALNVDRTTRSWHRSGRKLLDIYDRLKLNELVREKRENRQEPARSRSVKKLSLEEKLDRFVKLKKGMASRRKRLLELSHKHLQKAEIRCRDTKECQTVMVTDFPEEDYVRSPPPKYFFSHDRVIVDPMEPSQLISNSTCRASEDVDYEEAGTTDRQRHLTFKNEGEKDLLEEKEKIADESVRPYLKFQKGDNKIRDKEKHQKLSGKKERVTHNIGGKIENNMLRGRTKMVELEGTQREKSSLRGDKKFNAEREQEFKGVGEMEKGSRSREKEPLNEGYPKYDKTQKIHFNPKNIKNLLQKSEERKLSKTKIRNFIMAKGREKQKFKSEFVKSHKKEEEADKRDEEKNKFIDKKYRENLENNAKEYKDDEPFEDKKFGDEQRQGQPLDSIRAEEVFEVSTGASEQNAEIQSRGPDQEGKEAGESGLEGENQKKRKYFKMEREGSLGDIRKESTPLGHGGGDDGALDFNVEIIQKQLPEMSNFRYDREFQFRGGMSGDVNQGETKMYFPDDMNKKTPHLNRQNYYKQSQKYYVLQKDRYNSPQNLYFIHETGSPALGVKGRQFRMNELGNQFNRDFGFGRGRTRAQPRYDTYYYGKPDHYYTPVSEYSNNNAEVKLKRPRQSFSTNYNNKIYKTQYQGNSEPEILFRKFEGFPGKTSFHEPIEEDPRSEESTREEIRSKRTADYSFEPARGFFSTELDFFRGEEPKKPIGSTVVHELEGCLSRDKESRGKRIESWIEKINGWQLAGTEPENSSMDSEIQPGLQKLQRKSSHAENISEREKTLSDKERLIQSYLNAPDYVLEEIEANLKGKRQARDQSKEDQDGDKGKGDLSKGGTGCENSQDTARCMRFGDLWYSVYMIKKPVIAQIVGVQLFDKHSLCDGTTQWRDLTKGKMVRIGTFLPKAEDELPTISMSFLGGKTKKLKSAIDPDNYMLLVPSHVSDPSKAGFYPQFDGGPAEYLLVQSKDISEGGDCNMIGTSFEAFARQPDRCSQLKGSCLKRQPVDLWREDMEARIRGKRGKYFVENFGTIPNSPVKTYTNLTGEYLALEYYGDYTSTIEIEVKADYNAIVRKGSSAQIPTVYIDGTYPKKTRIILSVLNIGLTSSYFRPRLGDCPPDLDPAWCPLEGPLVTIPPQQRHDFKLDLSGVLPPNKIHATVQVLNQLNKKIAYRKIVIKRGDRCICAFHCKCNCIGNVMDGRTCKKLPPEEYRGAGYLGSFPFRGDASGSASESLLGNLHIVIITASYVLLFLGVMKAILGIFIRRIGIAGTRVIVGPKKLRCYYESDLECCAVHFDECGFPVHPTTYQPVQIVPLGIGFLIMTLPCCKTMCADCDGCFQQEESRGFDQKCSRPLLSKYHHPACASYNLTAINTKKVKADEYLPYLPYKGDDDPLEEDDTEFVLQEMKRHRQK